MKTIILNGSPKTNDKSSNTEIFIQQFTSKVQGDYEVKYIAKEKPEVLAKYIKQVDMILMVMPLYIHAMPTGVMSFIEHMEPATSKEQAIGFIVQAGFPESAHEAYICAYFESLAKKCHYQYRGTVVKGNAAFVYKAPEQYKELYKMLAELGQIFENTQVFDEQITKTLAKPYKFSKFDCVVLRIIKKLGLMDGQWNEMLKQNNALEHALDRPFLDE